MKTLKKRILSGAMAGVLAMSLAVPAFASGTGTTTTPTNMTTAFDGSYEAPNIDVVVPQTGTVVINPYGLGVTATKTGGGKVNLTGQVMSVPLAVTNKTGMWLTVGATATAVLPTDTTMKLTAASTKGSGTEGEEGYVAPATGKSAFIQLEVVQAPASVVGANDAAIADLVIDASAVAANWTNSGKIVVSAKGATNENLATLKPATMGGTNGAFSAYAAGSVGLVRLSGDCTSGPKAPWDENDTFNVNVVFSFVPTEAPSHRIITTGVTGATADITSAKVGEAVVVTLTGTDSKTYNPATALAVTDADGGTVTVTTAAVGGGAASGAAAITASFTMPDSDVTITGTFD